MKRIRNILVVSVAALLVAASAQAAVITWGTPTTIASSNEVSTAGTLHAADDVYSLDAADLTVNSVVFPRGAPGVGDIGLAGGAFAYTVGTVVTDDPNYDTLIERNWGGIAGVTGTLTIASLVVSQEYEIQYWANDNRFSSVWGRTATLQDQSGGSSVTLDLNQSAAGLMGDFVIGTFTADAATQVVDLTGSAGFIITAVQVRTIPEPATLGLLGIGMLLMVLRRRAR